MAGTGTYSAYRQLKPLEGDISQDIQQQQENLFKRDAIEQQRAKNKADAEAKVKELKQKELDKVKYPVNPDVKVQTLTDYGAKALRVASNRIGEISSKLYGNKKLLPEEDEDELRLELNNLQNTPELLKSSASALTAQSEDYRKRLAEGKIRPNLKFETFINNGATGWEPHFDSKGNLMTAFMDKDVNDDGVVDKLDLVSYDDLAGHTGTFQFDNAYDIVALLKEDQETLESPVNAKDNGSLKTTTTGFKTLDKATGVPVAVLDRAKYRLFKEDGTVTDIGRDVAEQSGISLMIKNEKGENVPNEKGFSKMTTDYAKGIYAGMKKGVVEDKNMELERIKQSERHYQQTRAEKKKDEPQEEMGLKNINQVGYVKGNTPAKGSVLKNMDGAKAYSIEGSNLERSIGKKGAYQRVNSIYVLKDGKTLAFEVDNVDGSESSMSEDGGEYKTSKTTKILYRSDRHTNEIGDFISKKKNPKTGDYYKNIPEFMEDALNIPQKKSAKKQNSKSIKAGYTEGGYRFKGGDTKNPKNWVKI